MKDQPQIHTLTLEQLDRLGIDDKKRLYWDGELVVTERTIKFGWVLNWSAVLAAAATVVSAVVTVLEYLDKVGIH